MTPAQLQRLHGILRDPHGAGPTAPGRPGPAGDEWWAAEAAADVSPETDSVLVGGTRVARGSLVRLHPSRRADAQDMFLAGHDARVSAVHVDLDGETHVAVTLVDDALLENGLLDDGLLENGPAELHDRYGRYLYFAPDELEPLAVATHGTDGTDGDQREENSS
jgi:hypothetical protein